jgi:hypothetical protein
MFTREMRVGHAHRRPGRVAGDKSGRWDQWYRDAIPAAEAAYEAYLKGRGQR